MREEVLVGRAWQEWKMRKADFYRIMRAKVGG